MRLFVDEDWLDWPALEKEEKMLTWIRKELKGKKFVIIEIGSGTYDLRVKVIKETNWIN